MTISESSNEITFSRLKLAVFFSKKYILGVVAIFIDASTRLAGLEASTTMDPFAALLNRAGGGSLQAGQGVVGEAGYGLNSGPQYLNPESGLGFISQMAANEASMYGAQQMANASQSSGLMGGLGSLFGGAAGGLLGNTNLFK